MDDPRQAHHPGRLPEEGVLHNFPGNGHLRCHLAGEGIDLDGQGFVAAADLHRELPGPADALVRRVEQPCAAQSVAAELPAHHLQADAPRPLWRHEKAHLLGLQLPDGQQPSGQVLVLLPGDRGAHQQGQVPRRVGQLEGEFHGRRLFSFSNSISILSQNPPPVKPQRGFCPRGPGEDSQILYKLGVFTW